MKFRPQFMGTTMEGMPHKNVEEACRVILLYFPEAPCIPRLDGGRLYIEGMPCLKIDREKKQVSFDLSSERESELIEFYERYFSDDLDYFAISPKSEPTLYKLAEMFKEKPWPQLKLIHFVVIGLYTWGFMIKDESGAPALYNNTSRDVMLKTLIMKIRWRQKKIKELFPNVPIMVTLGNGALGVYSSAGGTGTWDDIKNDYNEMIEAVKGITCIHCCSNFDWSLLMETNTDCINFDAYQYGSTMSLYPDALKRFLERGGMISWGIVPTTPGDIENENPSSLVQRLERAMQLLIDTGIDKDLLLESSWITPSCEPSTMTIELAEKAFSFTKDVSQRMREKYFG